VAEQAVAAEQITKAALDLARQLSSLNRGVAEQASGAAELTDAVDAMRVQADQAARATAEQARTVREMSKATHETSRDIRLVSDANLSQSASAARVSAQLADIRRITERNADGVRRTKGGTVELLKKTDDLTGFISLSENGHGPSRRAR
jgi:methyl-accepting chemotaxis protein